MASKAAQVDGKTVVVVEEKEEASQVATPVYTIPLNPRPRVTFDESVIDNEFMGKKKSKSKLIAITVL